MSPNADHHPIGWEHLLAYVRDPLDEAELQAIEAHYFECNECSHRLAWLHRLGRTVTSLVRAGAISASGTSGWVEKAGAEGVSLRTYRLAPGETVLCTAAPEDDFVLVRLAMDIDPTESVTLVTDVLFHPTGQSERRIVEDVVVDRTAGEVLYFHSGDLVRQFPRSRWSMEAQVRGTSRTRTLGPYVLEHTPWEELQSRS